MNILLLIFFAIPVATIILSAIFETLIRSPLKIAGIAFSIFLIVAFALGGTVELLVAAIIYTILAFITAYLVCLFYNRDRHHFCNNSNNNRSLGNELELSTPPSQTTNANFFNNDFQDSGFTAQIGETTVSNNVETTTGTCPYRRYR